MLPDRRILQFIREAPEPPTTDELLQFVPEHAAVTKTRARQWLANNALNRPEVGRVRRGAYVYLPDHVTGSTLRVPLIGSEGEDGRLRIGPDAAMALWFRQENSQYIARGSSAGCMLPDGRNGTLTWEPGWHAGSAEGAILSEEFQRWLQETRPRPGDSLLLHILDGERSRCSVTLERLAERDPERVLARSRELGNAVEAVLREARRRLHIFALMAWLLARDSYHDACPPDPLLPVLVLREDRFEIDRYGEVAMATKWDRLVVEEDDFLGLLAAEREAVSADKDLPDDLLRVLSAAAPASVRSIFELTPWLIAVGYAEQERGAREAEEEESETRREVAQAYRLRIAFTHRKTIWRTIEVSDHDTLGALDRAIRVAFEHDLGDHLSEFSVPSGGRRGEKGLGHIEPGGGGSGYAVRVGDLGLDTGDRLKYVYDFGDWVEHDIVVQAVLPADPSAEYPREIARNAPRYRNCQACAARGRKERAIWYCMECSNRYGREVVLCEACLTEDHPEHYAEEIVY
jgi:hypothetical protein